MKYVDFRKFTDEQGACPIYLFEGEDGYFREKGEELLKEKFLGEPTLDYTAFEGGTLKGDKLKNLVDAWLSYPFVGPKRFVKVTDFYPTQKDYDAYLKKYFENPPADGLLFICNSGKGKAGTAALSKAKNVTVVDCSRSDEETVKKWIHLTCKRAGVYIDGLTCGMLAGYCLCDMLRVSKATEKLLSVCVALGEAKITDAMVEEHVHPDAEYKIFELANAILAKNYAEYVKILGDLSSKNFDAVSLLSSLAASFKTIYDVSMTKGTDREVATALGISEYVVKKNRSIASRTGKEKVLGNYQALYETISLIKCGEITPSSALKLTTARLFA
ncbi:MAG: DNA polymerase III subunit delta [Clostridia bacterium]|nr:DNA polymerase III subunit delta [Clostridia bacterium]